MRHASVLSATFGCLLAAAPAQKLKVGDPAPPLQIEKWVKGDAVDEFARDKAYVVEFWATWCGPCIASMPHLSKLQEEHGKDGLTIIGVTSEDPNNSLQAVEAMVKTKGDGMGYTVAWDDGRATSNAYMKAAGQNGIPCSFVVDKEGKVAYIGHPMWLDVVLPDVLGGTWDPAKGREKITAAEKRLTGLGRTMRTDPAKAAAEAEALIAEHPALASMLQGMQFQAWLQAKQWDKAYAVAGKMVDRAIADKDTATLNQVAWTIVDPEGSVEQRDLDLALRAAEKGVALTESKDANVLDTLARVHFWKKDLAKALEFQRKAVELDDREELRKALAEYEKAAGDGK